MYKSFNEFKGILKEVTLVWIAVGVVLVVFYIFGDTQSGFALRQFAAVIISTVFSATATCLLLIGQTKSMEKRREIDSKKDKEVKIYTQKINSFSSFNKEVWGKKLETVEHNEKAEIILQIREQLYTRAIFYLSPEEIERISEIVIGRENKPFPLILSSITNVLNENAIGTLESRTNSNRDMKFEESCHNLWSCFNDWMHSYDNELNHECEEIVRGETIRPKEQIPNETSLEVTIKSQSWHFCMLDDTQIDYLKIDSKDKELSLIEYGESWRTQRVKEIKEDDIVFLYIRGRRYAGVFRAIGWRVLNYSTDDRGKRIVREETSVGVEKKVVLSEWKYIDEVKEILAGYDIYESYKDAESSSCANVVVETLSFIPTGVFSPNPPYRPAISRYYRQYAESLLSEFLKRDPEFEEHLKQIPSISLKRE